MGPECQCAKIHSRSCPDGKVYPFSRSLKAGRGRKFRFNTELFESPYWRPRPPDFRSFKACLENMDNIQYTGLDYAGTVEARRTLAEDLVQEALHSVGGFDPEALEVVRDFVMNPFQEKIIGTSQYHYSELVMDTQGLVDALAKIGITDTNEVEKYVELWGKTVGAGMKTGAYGGNINLSTRPLSVVAAEALERRTAWLRDLAEETGAPTRKGS